MKSYHSIIIVGFEIVFILSACVGANYGDRSSSTPFSITSEHKYTPLTPSTESTVVKPSTINDPGSVKIIESAKIDLVERLGIPADQIQVSQAIPVTWPDTSLGCPQPGMAYATVRIPGYVILLEAQGNQFPFHTDLDDQVILCETSSEIIDAKKEIDNNVTDGWPNQTKDDDVIIFTPTKRP